MAEITLVARFVAKAGKEHELKAVLASVIATTQAEAGCKIYDLYESPETGRFFFWELWESQEALDAHANAPHIKKLVAQAGDLISEPIELSSLKAVNK
jgi:quinol monooxygenase YgiN